MNMLVTHMEGTDCTRSAELNDTPRNISREFHDYYAHDYCIADMGRMNGPAGRGVWLLLIDKRDAGKPLHEFRHPTIDLYFEFI